MKKPKDHYVHYKVSFIVPEGAKASDCRDALADALSSWGGDLRPPGCYGLDDLGDPFFSFGRQHGVRISRLHKIKKRA